MRGSPRRDALEYAMLMFCTTSLTAGMGLMLYLRKNGMDEKIDLNAPFDMKGALSELSQLRDKVLSGNVGNPKDGGSSPQSPSQER